MVIRRQINDRSVRSFFDTSLGRSLMEGPSWDPSTSSPVNGVKEGPQLASPIEFHTSRSTRVVRSCPSSCTKTKVKISSKVAAFQESQSSESALQLARSKQALLASQLLLWTCCRFSNMPPPNWLLWIRRYRLRVHGNQLAMARLCRFVKSQLVVNWDIAAVSRIYLG